MSDVFNSSEAKRKISEFFNVNIKENAPSEDAFMPPTTWVPPKDPIRNPREMENKLDAAHVVVYKPMAIASNIPEPAMDLLGRSSIAPLIPPATILMFPGGDSEYFPKYYTQHWHGEYDKGLFSQMVYVSLSRPGEEEESIRHELQSMRNAIQEFMYGTGTYAGQTDRLIAMTDIRFGRNGKHAPKGLSGMGLTLEGMAEILEETLPLGVLPEDHPPLFFTPDNMVFPNPVNPEDLDDFLPEIKGNTAAGLPYLGDPKKTRVFEAITLASMFIKGISGALRSGKDKDLQTTLSDFWYLGCGIFFPKNERYEKSKWTTKTRNIWSAPFPTHILMSMLSSPIIKNTHVNAWNYDTPSLKGFNPFASTHNLLMEAIQPGTRAYIYADNIYVSYHEEDGTHTWFSLDLEKAEAGATPEDAQAVAYYLLTRGWVDEESGTPLFNATWAYFLLNVAPHLAVDSISLLMNLQFRLPGQGSGNPWTFLINHVVSSKLWAAWRDDAKRTTASKGPKPKYRPPSQRTESPEEGPTLPDQEMWDYARPGSQRWERLCAQAGINIKIELTTPDLEGELDRLRNTTPVEGWLQLPDATGPASTSLPRVAIDLLGFSAVWSHQLKKFIPVLDETRLWPSAAYPRKLENRDLKKDKLAAGAYGVVRLEALRLVGGWSHPILDQACANNAENKRANLERAGLDITQYQANWGRMTEFGDVLDDETVTLIDISRSMTNSDLVNLHRDRTPPEPVISSFTYNPITKGREAEGLRRQFPSTQKAASITLAHALGDYTSIASLTDYAREFAAAKEAGAPTRGMERELKKRTLRALDVVQDLREKFLKPMVKNKLLPAMPGEAHNPNVTFHIKSEGTPTGSSAKKTGTGHTGLLKSLQEARIEPITQGNLNRNQRKMAKRRLKLSEIREATRGLKE